MLHTFRASAPSTNDSQDPQRSTVNRRISTSHACHECRRRKIRCDGAKPCQQCVWYRHPELCNYPQPSRKALPSRKLLDDLQNQVAELTQVCSRLFPGQNPEHLARMSREDLVQLLLRLQPQSASPGLSSSPILVGHAASSSGTKAVETATTPAGSTTSLNTAPISSAGADSLSALEQAPDRDPEMDEAQRSSQPIQAISDDVNALSISVRRQSSYVGVSSPGAALEVIFKMEPSVRTYMAQYHNEAANISRRNSWTQVMLASDLSPTTLPAPDVGQKYIETYFLRVHPMMPMLDEQEFWHLYLYTHREDGPWLALLNIVFALGALADRTSGEHDHFVFSTRARAQFTFEMFGSGNLFMLQALGLLTGYYLHWLSRPNEANALMGAALRMATAMGLHREFSTTPKTRTAQIPADTRRRTWWSLVCLDTWAAMTTGRPSLGRLGLGITVEAPKIPGHTNNAQYLASIKLLPIVHNIDFCHIATRVQDQLASKTILPPEDLNSLDAELVRWHDELPPVLRDATPSVSPELDGVGSGSRGSISSSYRPNQSSPGEPSKDPAPGDREYSACPEQLKTPRLIMYWWYMTLRVLAHRPLLLASALRRLPINALTGEEQMIVSKCRQLAGQTIADISRTTSKDVIGCWNAVWMIYQAVMVPLVSLFMHTSLQRTSGASAGTEQEIESWHNQIRNTIDFFGRVDDVVVTARKSKLMVERLYEANRQTAMSIPLPPPTQVEPASEPFEMTAQDLSSGAQDIALGSTADSGMIGDMSLDDWLQTYNEQSDVTWNDMLWTYTMEGDQLGGMDSR